jgi:hypothetical protein
MVLLSLEVILLHSSFEDPLTGVTAQGKVLVVTVGAEWSFIPACKGSINEGVTTV